jgi:hypothetical protein
VQAVSGTIQIADGSSETIPMAWSSAAVGGALPSRSTAVHRDAGVI